MPSNRILTSPMCDSGQMSRPFASDRDWVFDVGPAELWSAMTEIESYPSWWPWLRRFDPGEGFEVGAAWRCEVARRSDSGSIGSSLHWLSATGVPGMNRACRDVPRTSGAGPSGH